MPNTLASPTGARLWHAAYCRWHDHREQGHDRRAAVWGWVADWIVRWA